MRRKGVRPEVILQSIYGTLKILHGVITRIYFLLSIVALCDAIALLECHASQVRSHDLST